MAQVSKYPLPKEVEERMFDVFWQTIANLTTKQSVKKFLYDLLSPTEKTMLAKRLGIAILLLKGYDYRSISEILKVSTATIMLINNWLKTEGDGYKTAIKKILKKEKQEEFWDNLEEKLMEIFPPRYGTQWKGKRKDYYERLKLRRRSRSIL